MASTRLLAVLDAIKAASAAANRSDLPVLVAVSKLKSPAEIRECYEAGQRHFGENYVNELTGKAEEMAGCGEICWHFIGSLQLSNVNKLLRVSRLSCIQSIDNAKLATKVNSSWRKLRPNSDPLSIFIQVNTSDEEQKGGVEIDKVPDLVQHVVDNCKSLNLTGLMTIGSLQNVSAENNSDFERLAAVRRSLSDRFDFASLLQLSMGMSQDFERAIANGSDVVRVGSAIFGSRPVKWGIFAIRPKDANFVD